jgi:hypothetical protein
VSFKVVSEQVLAVVVAFHVECVNSCGPSQLHLHLALDWLARQRCGCSEGNHSLQAKADDRL